MVITSDGDIEVPRRGVAIVYTPTSESIRGADWDLGVRPSIAPASIRALGPTARRWTKKHDTVEQVKATCFLQAVRHGDADAVTPRCGPGHITMAL